MAPIAVDRVTPAPIAALKSSAQASTSSVQFHVTSTPCPIAESSSGLTFTLNDGRTVIDCMSGGAAVACLGSDNPDLVQVMANQAAKMPYAYHQLLGNQPGEDLARFLIDRSEGNFAAAAFLNSGSEAMEAALKMVRQFWLEVGQPKRQYVIARFPSYHGNTLGALAVSTQTQAPQRQRFADHVGRQRSRSSQPLLSLHPRRVQACSLADLQAQRL